MGSVSILSWVSGRWKEGLQGLGEAMVTRGGVSWDSQAVHRTEMQAAGQAGAKTGMSKENLLSLGPTSPEF